MSSIVLPLLQSKIQIKPDILFFPNIDNLFQSLSDKFQTNFSANPHQNTLVMRQKGKSENGGYKKTKHAKFSEKLTFLAPDRNSTYQ